MNPKAVGERSEGLILAKFLNLGVPVSVPFGDNQRYDMILDIDGKLLRVQCKTGRLRKGVVKFNAHSVDRKTGKRRCYKGEIDLFVVYCPDNGKFYRVPVGAVGTGQPYIRVEPVKSQQVKGIRSATNFEI